MNDEKEIKFHGFFQVIILFELLGLRQPLGGCHFGLKRYTVNLDKKDRAYFG